MPDESVDLVLTDPPYNLGNKFNKLVARGKFGRKFNRDLVNTTLEFDSFPNEKNYLAFLDGIFQEINRICKKDANFVTFIDWRYISFIINKFEELGWKFRNVFAWVKKNPCPQLRKCNFAQGLELAVWMSRGKNTFNYQLGHQPNYKIAPLNSCAFHPTQKHIEVIKTLIAYLSKEKDVILDPFLGSGTTMLAALQLNRNCVGVEINLDYIKIIKDRLHWGSSLNPNIQFEFKVIE
ncbi:MAG: DNA-methyltransferase [Candidatus Baldrarchaeia archaeon]